MENLEESSGRPDNRAGSPSQEESPVHGMAQRDWFNVLCKTVGVYWLAYGVTTIVELVYWTVVRNIGHPPPYALSRQAATMLWGVSMLVVGGFLMLRSRTITKFAFMFEADDSDNSAPDLLETGEPDIEATNSAESTGED